MNANTRHLPGGTARSERVLEGLLIAIVGGLVLLLHLTGSMKMVVLHLFCLPVVLAGFFLGRYRAGVLALLSFVAAAAVVSQDPGGFAGPASPLLAGLAMTVWGAVLGLTAILVGTLCDDLVRRTTEVHEAHVGVMEVLARYLQAANPHLESRARKVAGLSEQVARRMRLSEREIDDIRVAALLMDIENIEITARVIRKAVGQLEDSDQQERTFHGTELVKSLGPVLSGVFPILLASSHSEIGAAADDADLPFGCRIIRTVRAWVDLTNGPCCPNDVPISDLLEELSLSSETEHHPAVLHALRQVIEHEQAADSRTPAAAVC